jgi:Icc protein
MSKQQNNEQPSKPIYGLPPGSVKILHITDTHLYGDQTKSLAGVNTEHSLSRILQLARKKVLPVDLVLLTGDLVHDGSEEGYQRIKEHLDTLDAPVYYLPGNHDQNRVLHSQLQSDRISMPAAAIHGDWLITMLDSSIQGSDSGHLDTNELVKLETTLNNHPDKYALVCLHHQPIPIGSGWMDRMVLDNPDEFFSILKQHSNVKLVLYGHVHQESDQQRDGIRLLSTPSTSIQFTPNQEKFGIDNAPPALRWLALLPNGQIQTSLHYLDTVPAGLDLKSPGYR